MKSALLALCLILFSTSPCFAQGVRCPYPSRWVWTDVGTGYCLMPPPPPVVYPQGYYQQPVPGILPWIGLGLAIHGLTHGHHGGYHGHYNGYRGGRHHGYRW